MSIIKPTRCTNFTNLFWHETLHVSCQNKFVKLVHLVGFIIKKFVTMQHGHTKFVTMQHGHTKFVTMQHGHTKFVTMQHGHTNIKLD